MAFKKLTTKNQLNDDNKKQQMILFVIYSSYFKKIRGVSQSKSQIPQMDAHARPGNHSQQNQKKTSCSRCVLKKTRTNTEDKTKNVLFKQKTERLPNTGSG